MKKNHPLKRKRRVPKAILRLPSFDHAKAVVLNSLKCPDAQRRYRHDIDEFIDWYCSEPCLAFNFSEVAGAGAAAAISNLYYPSCERTWTKTYQRWLLNFFIDGITVVFREFWPDINHAIFHDK